MPILKTCCCWGSIRRGSIACGVYTGIYYLLNAAHSWSIVEIIYSNATTTPASTSDDLNIDNTSPVFTCLILVLSSTGIVATILLSIGIFKDVKGLLVPWIFNLVVFTLTDLCYVVHGLIVKKFRWNPPLAMLILTDIFLNSLNLYAILCVISLYQEYKSGTRTRDIAHINNLNTQGSTSSNIRKPPSYVNKVQPSTCPTETKLLDSSPQTKKPKKCVKFGDDAPLKLDVSPMRENSGSGGVDTTPLISTAPTVVKV